MTNTQKYAGVIVPMISPLSASGDIDRDACRRIVEHIVTADCAPFLAGTTGESHSLDDLQKATLVAETVSQTGGRQPVYAGISDNCLSSAIAKARDYSVLGADVAVAHLPCYYTIERDEMEAWYRQLADQSPLPVIIYNIPSTTGLSMPLDLVDRLSSHDNIVGLKESERGDDRLDRALALWGDREDFTFHLGWAAKSAYGLARGLDGIVPSSANFVPALYRQLYQAAKSGDVQEAERLQSLTDDISLYYQDGRVLSRSLPMLKAMMASADLCEAHAAPPMLTLAGSDVARIGEDLRARFGLSGGSLT